MRLTKQIFTKKVTKHVYVNVTKGSGELCFKKSKYI